MQLARFFVAHMQRTPQQQEPGLVVLLAYERGQDRRDLRLQHAAQGCGIRLRSQGLLQTACHGAHDAAQILENDGTGRIVQALLAAEMERDEPLIAAGQPGDIASARPLEAAFPKQDQGRFQQGHPGSLSLAASFILQHIVHALPPALDRSAPYNFSQSID